jgi:hypothetical protein
MNTIAELHWFDRLASKTIDGALRAVVGENRTKYPGYIIDEQLDPSPTRERCLLVIKSSDAREMSRLTGGLDVGKASGDKVQVRKSFAWHNSGQPDVIAVFERDRVAEADIQKLASDFVAEFFAQLPDRANG